MDDRYDLPLGEPPLLETASHHRRSAAVGNDDSPLGLVRASSHPGDPHETFAFCPPRTPSRAHSPDDFELHRVYAPLALSPSESTATRWAEKTPRNVLSFGAILDHFGEDVRLIHIVRDGRDATTSRHLRDPATYYYDAGSWAATVSHGLQFRDHPQVTLVRYEDLVLDFAATTARLCTFLDEPVDRQIVDWFNHASVRTHTAWRGSVQSMYDTSIGRWRRPEHARQVELFYKNARAMALLAELGYDSEA